MTTMKISAPPQFGSIVLQGKGKRVDSCTVTFDDKPYVYFQKSGSTQKEPLGQYNPDFFEEKGYKTAVSAKDKEVLQDLLNYDVSTLKNVIDPYISKGNKSEQQKRLHTLYYGNWFFNDSKWDWLRLMGISERKIVEVDGKKYGKYDDSFSYIFPFNKSLNNHATETFKRLYDYSNSLTAIVSAVLKDPKKIRFEENGFTISRPSKSSGAKV